MSVASGISQSTSMKKTTKDLQVTKAHSFLLKLHNMLQDAKSKGFDHIISWSKHKSDHEKNLTGSGSGPAVFSFSSFVIHQPKLMPPILSQYFCLSLYKSFCRQLKNYNFPEKTMLSQERFLLFLHHPPNTKE